MSALLQAFHPKWCSSSPLVGSSVQPTIFPYVLESGSVSITVSASAFFPARSKATTYASFSSGAAIASSGVR